MLKPILVTSFYTIIAIQNSSCFIWICCKDLLVGLPTHTSLIFLKDSFQKAVKFTAYRSCSFLTPNSAGILNQEYGKASQPRCLLFNFYQSPKLSLAILPSTIIIPLNPLGATLSCLALLLSSCSLLVECFTSRVLCSLDHSFSL